MSAPPLDPHDLNAGIKRGELRHLSPSSLSDADTCMKRLEYRWDPNIPKGTSEAALVGKGYHAGLEWLYTCRRDGLFEASPRDIEVTGLSAFEAESAKFEDWDTSREEARGRVSALLDRYLVENCAWPADAWEVVAVEQEMLVELHGRWVMKMVIDLAVRNRTDGSLIIVDHKTAKRKWPKDKEHPRKNLQAVLYPWAWWRLTGEEPDGVCFDVMNLKGDFERRYAQPNQHHYEAVLNKALGLTVIVDNVPMSALPANPSSNLCSSQYCDFWSICPFGQAAVS